MIDKCPECGEPLEATVPLYLSNVTLNDDGSILSFHLAFGDDDSAAITDAVTDCDPSVVSIYCSNDHPYPPEPAHDATCNGMDPCDMGH